MTEPLHLFEVLVTPGVGEALKDQPDRVEALLAAHQTHNWGLIDDEDRQKNQRVIDGEQPGMVMSVYLLDPSFADSSENRIWIITDQIAKVTTVLLPSEY
jgi:hypothetical protein